MSRQLYLVPWRGVTRFQEFRVGLLSYVTNSDRGANSSSGFHVPDIDGYRWLAMFLMCLRYSYHGVSIFLLGLLYSYHGVSIFLVLYMRARKASLVVPA
jgi:hypothetical protein